MKKLRQVLSRIDRINEWTAKATSWLIGIIIAATTYEVIMRYAFQRPTTWSFELNYLVFGAYFMLTGAYTHARKGHVNVDILHGRLSPRGKAIADLVTFPVFFLFVGVMIYKGFGFALDAWEFRETLSSAWAPPVYPFKTVIPVAAFLLFLQGVAKFIRDLHTLVTGKEGGL
jgi:TRAP-type mannitol/chloroaromatic compound transport system permease small subunit